jgi:glycosyltransferase involved in cell wall biosynthesis
MKVLHVIPSIGPLRGGPSIAMGTIARALRDGGVQVDVATTNDNDSELLNVPLEQAVDESGVRYWYFARTAYPYTTSTGLARWLRKRAGDYDIIHTHALFSFSTSVAAAAARKFAVPYIVRPLGTLAPYGMEQHSFLKRVSWMMVERRLLTQAAAIHFTSEAEREDAERLGKWRSVVVPLGVPAPAHAARIHSDANPLVFLFLSRIHPKKRVDLLLEAFAVVRKTQPARLLIAGTGEQDYVTKLKALAERLGVTDAVSWTGHLRGTDKERVLAEAHAFVLPSINENFGIAPVEALAAGLPVIVSRGVAIHREVEEANAGVVVADDAHSLAAGMLGMQNTTERAAMSANAEQLARAHFSIEAMQSGLIAMYERVLAA